MSSKLFLLCFILLQIGILAWILKINLGKKETFKSTLNGRCIYWMDSQPAKTEALKELCKYFEQNENNNSIGATTISESNALNSLLDVCPEDYLYVSPTERQFVMRNCKNARPLSEVLSVVLNIEDKNACDVDLANILFGLNQFYPSISVYVPSVQSKCLRLEAYKNVQTVAVNSSWKSGKIWNKLISSVTTPYVLVGRNLNYFDYFSQIERQLRMVSYIPEIQIAGGSQRNRTGHWRVGCYQINLRNYILEYVEGYYVSRNSCMFCDHLLGSFISTKDFLTKFPFDEQFPAAVLFEEFFIRLKNSSYGIVSCPDAMYFSTDQLEQKRIDDRSVWLPLVQKIELNRVLLPENTKHIFSCQESKSKCGKSMLDGTKWLLLPLCCIEEFARLTQFFHNFAVQNNIPYLLNGGTLLGAIKMNMLIPWDLDGDILFYESNFSFLINSSEIFERNGFKLSEIEPPKPGRNAAFHIMSPSMYIEMLGVNVTTRDIYMPSVFRNVYTKQRFNKAWMFSQTSPGLYARNFYGWEILKHSNHWYHAGNKNQMELYRSGKFNRCNKPGHHACEDSFAADGNLQFFIL